MSYSVQAPKKNKVVKDYNDDGENIANPLLGVNVKR